jgi:hypothetical protein
MIELQVNKLTCKINDLTKNYSFLDKMFLIDLVSKRKLLLYSQVYIKYNLQNNIINDSLLNTLLEEYISFLIENELKINEKKSMYVVRKIEANSNTIELFLSFFSNSPTLKSDLAFLITKFEHMLTNDLSGNIFAKINEFLALWSLPNSYLQIDQLIDNISKGTYSVSDIKTEIKNLDEIVTIDKNSNNNNNNGTISYQTNEKKLNNKVIDNFLYEPFEPSDLDTINFDIPTNSQTIKTEITDMETDTYTKSTNTNSINKRIKELLEITTTDTNEF